MLGVIGVMSLWVLAGGQAVLMVGLVFVVVDLSRVALLGVWLGSMRSSSVSGSVEVVDTGFSNIFLLVMVTQARTEGMLPVLC